MSVVNDVVNFGLTIATDPRYGRAVSYLLIVCDLILSIGIVKKIPYTEIDWETYMQQIALFRKGERNYANIKGSTGPLVYPAGHVYIFNALYEITDGGQDRARTQAIFLAVYILNLALVLKCYRLAKVPPWIMPLLVLSKRLHSIYLLRFFNDCFSTLFMFTATRFLLDRKYMLCAIVYSLSTSIKMSSLLYLPAIALLSRMSAGRDKAISMAFTMVLLQVLFALPFTLTSNASLESYMGRAFEFSRQFMWKWTVNWRFAGRETFESGQFHKLLLGLHVALLAIFAITRWIKPSKKNPISFAVYALSGGSAEEERAVSQRITPNIVLTTLLSCNAIGMLCARSLHYQFYSWLAWGTPYLLWKSGLGPIFVATVWLLQEVAWNVYPSTPLSSALVVGSMALQVAGIWWGTRRTVAVENEDTPTEEMKKNRNKKNKQK